MKKYFRLFKNWRRLGFKGQALWLFVFVFCGVARLMILLLPFRWLAKFLGEHKGNKEINSCTCTRQKEKSLLIAKIVRQVVPYTPWESKCLVQALVASQLLKFFKVPYVVYFGLRKDSGDKLRAHAWVVSGSSYITGKSEGALFTIVSVFASLR